MAPPKLNLVCSLDGCDAPLVARGYCRKHYTRFRKYGDPRTVKLRQIHGASLPERWSAYVGQRGASCWEWTGYRDPNGYGRLTVDNIPILAHRISWELHFGPITPEDHILHRCDNPACVRPEHLFKGNQAANMADKMAKKRHRYGVSRGADNALSKLTEEQVREIRASLETPGELAERLGVSRRTIRDIITRRSWKHLP